MVNKLAYKKDKSKLNKEKKALLKKLKKLILYIKNPTFLRY